MLQEDVAEAKQSEYAEPLKRINKAGRHLLQLINEILDISKIESGKLELYSEDVDVTALIEEVCDPASASDTQSAPQCVAEKFACTGEALLQEVRELVIRCVHR
jgi:adenylate cyclase